MNGEVATFPIATQRHTLAVAESPDGDSKAGVAFYKTSGQRPIGAACSSVSVGDRPFLAEVACYQAFPVSLAGVF